MLSFVEKYKGGTWSQNGEASIIDECIKRIGMTPSVVVEFGAPTPSYCSNLYHLMKRHEGWVPMWYDIAPHPETNLVEQREITPANVNDLPKCSILSIDIDGNDYEVWKAYNGAPDIVIIEINSSLPPMSKWFSVDKGSSYITMLLLGLEKGYFLLCHTGNLIFIHGEHRGLFPEIVGDGLENWEEYFNKSWL